MPLNADDPEKGIPNPPSHVDRYCSVVRQRTRKNVDRSHLPKGCATNIGGSVETIELSRRNCRFMEPFEDDGMNFVTRTICSRALCAITSVGIFASGAANAGLILNQVQYEGSDCAGVFATGNGFDTCKVDGAEEGSPIIIKFNGDYSVNQIAYAFPTIDGSEWSFTGASGGTSGTFTYNPDADDPAVRYWVVKAGNQFSLSYYTNDVLGSFDAAVQIPVGEAIEWTTGVRQGLSHFSFYDTGSGSSVPAPGTFAILLVSLGMLGFTLRSRTTDCPIPNQHRS